jgi:hypothetical protein
VICAKTSSRDRRFKRTKSEAWERQKLERRRKARRAALEATVG